VTGLWILVVVLFAAMAGSEFVLRGTKLQTGLGRVLVTWAAVWIFSLYPLFRYGAVDPIAFTLFWGGAFLSWFGVRSHIESSILLRMLHLLRRGPTSEPEILKAYLEHAGPNARIEELLRGGLARKVGATTIVTSKGKTILGVVARLR
jgi:hypothetical protein